MILGGLAEKNARGSLEHRKVRKKLRERSVKKTVVADLHEELDWEDLTDPASPHFLPEWWQYLNIPDELPVHHIADDFLKAKRLLDDIHFSGRATALYSKARKNDSNKPLDIVAAAYKYLQELEPLIEEKISHQNLDRDFLWQWGHFQRGIGEITASLPHIKNYRGLLEEAALKKKARQKQWYCLCKQHFSKRSQDKFNGDFAQFLAEIFLGKRRLPLNDLKERGFTVSQFKSFILEMFSEETVRSNLTFGPSTAQLASAYYGSKLSGKVFQEILAVAQAEQAKLPPSDPDKYPLI
jgi:hypothetical protein